MTVSPACVIAAIGSVIATKLARKAEAAEHHRWYPVAALLPTVWMEPLRRASLKLCNKFLAQHAEGLSTVVATVT